MGFSGKPKQDRYIRPDEVKSLLTSARVDEYDYFFLRMMLATGMRTIEATRLTLDDVDLERQGVWVKTAKRKDHIRLISIDEKTMTILVKITRDRDSGFLFLRRDKRYRNEKVIPITIRMAKDIFKYYANRAGIRPELSIHSTRHYHGTSCAEMGLSPQEVAARLGHSNLNTTFGYFTLRDGRNREVAEKFCHDFL